MTKTVSTTFTVEDFFASKGIPFVGLRLIKVVKRSTEFEKGQNNNGQD